MNEQNKPLIEIKTYFDDLKEIKELLPQIATLQQKYAVKLNINVFPSEKVSVETKLDGKTIASNDY